MQVVNIKAETRTALGKKGAKATRKEGRIPCVLYGGDEVIHFSTTQNEVRHLIYTPDFKIAEVEVDGKPFRCIVKEKQYHPVTDSILHLDFLRLEDGRPIKVQVPIRFKGTSPGVKSGGKLIQNVRNVTIKALPENIIDEVTVDISKLDLGQSIRIRDIQVGEGLEITNAQGIPIATIEIPRALRSAQQAAAAAAAPPKKK